MGIWPHLKVGDL